MKKDEAVRLTDALREELRALALRPDSEIDTSDMPEVTDWSDAVRGSLFPPVKRPLSLRLDADVIAWFKQGGDGYQTRINAVLRAYIEQHSRDYSS